LDALSLREGNRAKPHLRFSLRQSHPAATDRTAADGKTAERRQDGSPGQVHFQEGQAFKAYLAVTDKKVGFEFEPRPAKGKKGATKTREPKEPAPKLDFTGQESIGACPKCGGKVFEGPDTYVCENSQKDTKPCKFKLSKVILEQPIDRTQAA